MEAGRHLAPRLHFLHPSKIGSIRLHCVGTVCLSGTHPHAPGSPSKYIVVHTLCMYCAVVWINPKGFKLRPIVQYVDGAHVHNHDTVVKENLDHQREWAHLVYTWSIVAPAHLSGKYKTRNQCHLSGQQPQQRLILVEMITSASLVPGDKIVSKIYDLHVRSNVMDQDST